MIRYLFSWSNYIPSGKQAAVPRKGTAAYFYSTKNELIRQSGSNSAISKNVEENFFSARKKKHREFLAEHPLPLVIMSRGTNKEPSILGGVTA